MAESIAPYDLSPEKAPSPDLLPGPRQRRGDCALAGMAVLALHGLLFTQYAWADAEDTFSLVPAVTWMHDDNLFRLSSSADPQSVLGKSTKADDITVSSLAFKVNKPYSLQRFELELDVKDYRYRNFDYLDYTSYPYNAAWRWSITPYLHGNLTTGQAKSSNNFTDYTGYTVLNTHTDKNSRFDGVFELSPAWHLLGGVAKTTSTNSQTTTGQSDYRIDITEAGIRHVFPSGSSVSYVTRSTRGDYFNQAEPNPFSLVDNRFDDRENEVQLTWLLTGKTTVDARVSRFQRSHAHFAERDYGGTVGNINLTWDITAKSRITAGVARELSSYQTPVSSYTKTDHFSVTPVWQISAKTSLRAKYDYAQRDYLGSLISSPANDRRDTLRTSLIALDWQPMRSVVISGSLQSDKRASTQSGADFKSNSISLTAQMTF